MNFNDYQHKSRKTAGYPAIGHPVIYPVLGLANEAGEVAGKVKKVFRDKEGEINEETRSMLKVELAMCSGTWRRSAPSWACPWTRWRSTTSTSSIPVSSGGRFAEMGMIDSGESRNKREESRREDE